MDQVVRVVGDVARVLCTEWASMTLAGDEVSVDARATNVYRSEGSEWKLVHHHADCNAEFAGIAATMGA